MLAASPDPLRTASGALSAFCPLDAFSVMAAEGTWRLGHHFPPPPQDETV